MRRIRKVKEGQVKERQREGIRRSRNGSEKASEGQGKERKYRTALPRDGLVGGKVRRDVAKVALDLVHEVGLFHHVVLAVSHLSVGDHASRWSDIAYMIGGKHGVGWRQTWRWLAANMAHQLLEVVGEHLPTDVDPLDGVVQFEVVEHWHLKRPVTRNTVQQHMFNNTRYNNT